MSKPLGVAVVVVGLALSLTSCGGDDDVVVGDDLADDTASASEDSPPGAGEADSGSEADAPSGAQDTASGPSEDETAGADDEDGADIDAVCRMNDELAAFNEEAVAEFGPGADVQQATETVAEIERRLEEMSQLAPDSVGDDLARYREALVRVFELGIEADFDFEAVPQDQMDAFIEEFPDLNLFGSSPVETRIRTWFEENCPSPFAF